MTSASSQSPALIRLYQSPIGKKLITGVTGLGLVAFVLIHLAGNLMLFFSPAAYNQFGQVVEQLGPLTWAIELLLVGFVLFHAALGLQIYLGRVKARTASYAAYQSVGTAVDTAEGKPSYQSLSSRSMIWTGGVLATFLVWHLATFKFGPRYVVPGATTRDLARLVFEIFHRPGYTAGYVAVMVVLGLHLRHGLWSAMQSLGLLRQSVRPLIYAVGTGLAVLVSLGFLGLPVAIYAGWLGG